MKIIRFVILCIVTAISLNIRAQHSSAVPRYEIRSYGIGSKDTYAAEIFVYLPKPNKDVDICIRKSTVHGVIFKGLAAGNGGNVQRAMADISAETKFAEFFSTFFADDAQCSHFVNIVDGTLRVEKAEKKLYRIRAVVSIQKDALRHYLEQQHIIESFKDLF